MAYPASSSSIRDPENRSKKMCACGNHSAKAKKPKCDWKEWRKHRKRQPFHN